MKKLSILHHSMLIDGRCPHCEGLDFIAGPRDGESRKVLCFNCKAEYNADPQGSKLIAVPTEAARLDEVYGILRRCRLCHCTTEKPCVSRQGLRCTWHSWDLCSICFEKKIVDKMVGSFSPRQQRPRGPQLPP